jgi:translocation and assembly module TamB
LSAPSTILFFSPNFIRAARHLTDTGVATLQAFAHLDRMDEPVAQNPDIVPRVRRFTKRRIFGAIFLLLLILLAIAWWQRFRLADDLVREQLDAAGVRATYQIDEIGFRTQRLKNLVLGDPANPDLTAKQVEVDIALGFGTPEVRAVRADGVRLRGRYVDGKLSFGALDKFQDPKSKEPFELPDLQVTATDTIISLSTPWGGIGAFVEGSGNVRDNFNTKLLLRSPALAGGGCVASALAFDGNLRIRSSEPELLGPMSAANINCAAQKLAVAGPALKGKVKLSKKFDDWVGDVSFAAGNARLSGQQLNSPAGRISFFGDKKRTEFEFQLDRAGYRSGDVSVAKLSGDAKGKVAFGERGVVTNASGGLQLGGGSVAPNMLSGLSGLANSTQATPIGPIMAALDPAAKNALRSFDGRLRYDVSSAPGKSPYVSIVGLNINSKSGAKIAQAGPLAISNGQLTEPVSLSISGGGLPEAEFALRRQGSGWAGTLALAPYASGGASINIPKLAFTSGASGAFRFDGQATLSGPLMGGRIEGLSLPVDGSWSGETFAMLNGCRQIRFARFQTGSLTLPAQSLQACADGGSILTAGRGGTRFALRSPSINGRGSLGSTPMAFKGANVRFSLSDGFAASNVSVDLGGADAMSRFTMAKLGGRFAGGGIKGTLEGGNGKIGNVPLLIEEANGNWGWNNSILTLDGMAQVSDAEQVDRFNTLSIPDMQLTLENSVINAMGHLHEPKTGIRIADVDIKHALSNSTGRALLAVDGLTFNDRLQPEMLTPLTLGAIANVNGVISGDGTIEWNAQGVKSRGKFGTNSLDFAAAFGPVSGLSTEVVFTDLLGMETAPSQIARLAEVNPGVAAFDGKIEYRLLPDQKVQIEAGRWPFFGGELILEPTVLDFDVAAKRELTFRLVGMDAEKFLGGYELQNIRVSGVFDGTLPMVFDQEGGRIVGGWLVSRPGGGEVSYLGQLAYEDMGYFANFAFDALKSIQFEEMQIGVDGNIGGEVVTEVRFRGLQQGTLARRNYITKQLAKLPIEFNVRINAEFLKIIDVIRTLYDPRFAAQRYQASVKANRAIDEITGTAEKPKTEPNPQ